MKRHPLLLVILLALVLANALLFAWGQGWLGGNPGSAQREPHRLAAQQHPDRFRPLDARSARDALQPLFCREIGAFTDEAAVQAAEGALQQLLRLVSGSWQRVERRQPGVYLLATRAARDKADAQRQRSVLERAGLAELRAQALMGEAEPSWVVSRHDSEEAAQAAQQAHRAKGLALRVVTQRVGVTQWWLRLPAVSASQAQAVHPAWPGGLRACSADTADAPDEAASAAVR